MRAYAAKAYGGPEVMALADMPDPEPGKGEVVVAVKASSVNPVDWKLRSGAMRLFTGSRFPKVYGCDVAGVVHKLGAGVTGWSAGDSVYGYSPIMFRRPGAHAEQVAMEANRLRRLPAGLTFEQAAALPVAALTAHNGLRQCGPLAGKAVIVNGATGGVGHFALQLAKARGARVTAVCSARNADRARSLGADVAIDYRAQDFTRGTERFDVVFDAYGKLGFAAASRALSPGGFYVSTLGNPSLMARALWQKLAGGKQIIFANMRDKEEDYAALEVDLGTGKVRPVIEKVFPLEQAAEAFASQESGGPVGKVVIRVAPGAI